MMVIRQTYVSWGILQFHASIKLRILMPCMVIFYDVTIYKTWLIKIY